MKFSWIGLLITVLFTLLLASGMLVWKHGLLSTVGGVAFWQSFASPGRLSVRHIQLEKDCGACHTPGASVTASSCLACHAEMERLLNREATAFHATIENCKACHREHQGRTAYISDMDHNLYAKIGLKRLKISNGSSNTGPANESFKFIKNIQLAEPPETALNCIACHRTEDPHYGYFGDECIACHTTRMWSLSRYIHPGESSKDCDQCHKAPPNHWMPMFKGMMPESRQRMGRIGGCYRCHTTKSWNDITGMPMHRGMHVPGRDE